MPISDSQTLITGVYRSGTEYVTQLLSGHPALSATMYHVNAGRFIRGVFAPLDNRNTLRDAIGETIKRLWVRYGLVLNGDEVLRQCGDISDMSWQRLYDAIMSVLWLNDSRRHWAEKCQLVWSTVPEFVNGMPNGRAIMVIRDPRSVVASFRAYTYAPPPAYLGAVFNCLDAFNKALSYRRTLPPDRFMVIRYEDAARMPEAYAERMLEFLGLDSGNATLDPTRWRDAGGEPWVANTAFLQTAEVFDVEASIHRWRSTLDEIDVGFTEAVCGDVMAAFDYPGSGTAADWKAIEARMSADPGVSEFLRRYQETHQGIEAFPTDPLSSTNWEERTKTP